MRAISRLDKMRSLCTTPYHSKPSSSSRPGSRPSTSPLANLDDQDFNPRNKPSGPVIATATPPGLRTTRLAATTTANNSETLGSSGTAAASKSRFTAQRRREPLQLRDQNAAPTTRTMRLAHNPKTQPSTATPTNTNLKMPFERASGLSGKGQQQQQQSPLPTLARGVNKPPLTPKIATRSSTPQQHPSVAVATPLPRRAQRPESSLGSLVGGPAREKDRDDVASPMTTFLNNITPRSGSRQSRVDSTNTTPNGTPQPDRFDGFESKSSLGAPGPKLDESRPSVTFSTVEVPGGPKQNVESKFFYASDASKPVISPSQPTRPYVSQPQKQSTFFYANGTNVSERSSTAAAPAPFTPAGATLNLQDNLMSKFVYADGSSNAQPTTRPSSIVSTASKVMTGRPGLGLQNAAYAGPRPSSPIKLAPFPVVVATATNPSVVTRQPVFPPPIGPTGPEARRTSGPETKPRLAGGGHSRGGSLTMAEPPAVARLMSAHSSQHPSESSSPSNVSSPGFTLFTGGPAASGFASLLQVADDFVEEEEEEEEDEEEDASGDGEEEKSAPSDSPRSPTKSSSLENPLDELIASARRERKVQDLQITNASLEAINRTLERQLRKQTAELRRYRRLSRSGRISLNSLGGRDRISSNSTVDGGGLARAGMGLDDLSEEESEIEAEEEEEEDLYSDSDSGSGDLSPGELALRDARHRFKDEERLQLDLSKHQQLLVDSQKMNQSLKRCLGWTEELIKEGKRALEYQVRVSEVTLGGRVLAPEDIEDQDEGSENAGDDTVHETKLALEHSVETGNKLDWGESLPDRDSGIELPADGG